MIRWQHIKSEGKQDETLQCSPVGLLRRRAPPPVGPGSGRSLGRRWRQLPVGTPSSRAQPATRETRELQTLLLDAEDPSAWRCPREGRECTIRAGAAPSPRHGWPLRRVTRVRPEGMAAGKPGSGYYIPPTRAMCKNPNPSLYENYTRKRNSWSRLCPRHV